MLRYNKNIVNEQILLTRLANAAIDIYAMVVTQSRSSRAVNLNLPTAQHELNMTKALTIQASDRVIKNLQAATSSHHRSLNEKISTIAKTTLENGGVTTTGILDQN